MPPTEPTSEAQKDSEVGAVGVLDTDLSFKIDGVSIIAEGRVLIHRPKVVATVDVRTEHHPPVTERSFGVGADREVIGVDQGLCDVARRRVGGKPVFSEG